MKDVTFGNYYPAASFVHKMDARVKILGVIAYIVAVFFHTNMTGMINEYRRAYLVDTLMLSTDQMSFFNTFTGIAGFALSFVYAMILDSKKIKNGQKFKPLGLAAAILVSLKNKNPVENIH